MTLGTLNHHGSKGIFSTEALVPERESERNPGSSRSRWHGREREKTSLAE